MTPSSAAVGVPAAEDDSPEPAAPQGEYAAAAPSPASTGSERRPGPRPRPGHKVELLAPAGGLDCGLAAFHYGADAIYLGLKKFSARAEAQNFTLEEVAKITAQAHGARPRRKVFVAVNTVIRQDELRELVETLGALDAIGVDALIVQDLGVLHLARAWFPRLALHASTQLAVHNRAGAETLARMGFSRVVLARELTLDEIRDVTASGAIETEVFVHGALCYAYSGLCLFSSQTLGRSGNRGSCAYSCRDSYTVTGAPDRLRDGTPTRRDPRTGFPFSMKDLALPDRLDELREAGVSCLKIEGRKKNALYVAASTDYYRRLLDGEVDAAVRTDMEADLQTVFSRPWTRLFVDSFKDKEVADRDTVGHRGTRIGTVERVLTPTRGSTYLRFRTGRALERHDGIQIDLARLGRPFGFAVEELRVVDPTRREGRPREVFEAGSGSVVDLRLPKGHPHVPVGAAVWCSSSQAVKRRFRVPELRADPSGHPVRVEARLAGNGAAVAMEVEGPGGPVTVVRIQAGSFEPARDLAKVQAGFETAFSRLGGTGFVLGSATLSNPEAVSVPVSIWNGLRRELAEALGEELAARRKAYLDRILATSLTADGPLPGHRADQAPGQGAAPVPGVATSSSPDPGPSPVPSPSAASLRWSLKVDRTSFLSAFEDADWEDLDEVVLEIDRDPAPEILEAAARIEARVGPGVLRLALPPLTRRWEERGLRSKLEKLRAAGYTRWEIANASGWSFLGVGSAGGMGGGRTGDPPWASGLDLASDWPLYLMNRAAAAELALRGVTRMALSPEDGIANMRALLSELGGRGVVIVHQDTPLFVAESCAYANLIGGCPGKANCAFETMEMVSSHGEKALAVDDHCRTLVLNQGAYCLADRLEELVSAGAERVRADFMHRPYLPEEVRDTWRMVRSGRSVPGGHHGNFDRGLV